MPTLLSDPTPKAFRIDNNIYASSLLNFNEKKSHSFHIRDLRKGKCLKIPSIGELSMERIPVNFILCVFEILSVFPFQVFFENKIEKKEETP